MKGIEVGRWRRDRECRGRYRSLTKSRLPFSSLLLMLSVTAGAADAPTVVDPWIRATPPNAPTAAAYLTIHGGDAPDRLSGARSTVAANVEIHMTMQHDGVTHMTAVEALTIPAHGAVTLAPSGEHLMLTGLKRALAPGESVVITLLFERGGPIEVTFPVVDARTEAHADQHGDHDGHH